jgi:aminopeptidase C
MKNVVIKVRLLLGILSVMLLNMFSNLQMIKAGHPVFFGCDVGKFSRSDDGIMDTALFEYEVSFENKSEQGSNVAIRALSTLLLVSQRLIAFV